MNTNPLRKKRGIALVVVLVFLVLLSVFVVSFFSNSQDELTAAQSFTGEVSASHLAESAVSVVMGQIREATSRTGGAWGSQPGMIRVYGSGGAASEEVDAFFKLYSSSDMIVSGKEVAAFDLSKEVPEGATDGWNNLPALWTDLNEYVSVPAATTSQNGQATQATLTQRYPILDPSLYQKVEGLDFIKNNDAVGTSASLPARMPVRWLYVLKDGTLTVPTGSEKNGTRAVWATASKAPSAANPIVGRVAFWTDDETSKVNINTAGGYSLKPLSASAFDGGKPAKDGNNKNITEDDYAGAFWDTPRVLTEFDRGQLDLTEFSSDMKRAGLAISQPVRGEFQRYPGHPSTTSLGLLFRDLPTNVGDSMQDAPYLLTSGQLALLAPRLQYSMDTSSEGHRARCSNFGTDRLISKFDEAPDLRVKRLYASVDELFFSQPDPALATAARVEMDKELKTVKSVLTPSLLEKMRFFLTAYSRAPELNLFGRPRVTMWPVRAVDTKNDEDKYWNASDRLLAFCSTMGPKVGGIDNGSVVTEEKVKRFLFQRKDPYSSTTDWTLTRNKELLAYLRALTDKPFPGFARGSFSDKYKDKNLYGGPNGETDANGRWQILAEMFDYIRCVNLRDSTHDKIIAKSTIDDFGVLHPTQAMVKDMEDYKYAPRGIVVPSAMSATGAMTASQVRLGFGRFPIISEASLVLYHAGYRAMVKYEGDAVAKERFVYSDIAYKTLDPMAETEETPAKLTMADGSVKNRESFEITDSMVRGFMVFETFNPMQGYAPVNGPASGSLETRKIFMEVDGLGAFSLSKMDGTPIASLGFLGNMKNSYNFGPASFWGGRNTGGCEGFFHTMVKLNTSSVGTATEYDPTFSSDPVNQQPFWYAFQTIPFTPLSPANVSKTWVQPCTQSGVLVPVTKTRTDRMGDKMRLNGGTITLKMKFDTTEIYKFPLTFPNAVVPVPIDLIRGGYAQDGEFADKGNFTNRSPSNLWYSSDPGGFLRSAGSGDNDDLWAASLNHTQRATGQIANKFDKPTRMVKSLAGRMTWLNRADSTSYTRSYDTTKIDYSQKWRNILQPGDVVRSVVFGVNPKDTMGTGSLGGTLRTDLRLAALSNELTTAYGPHPDYQSEDIRQAQNLRMSDGSIYFPGKPLTAEPVPNQPPPPTLPLDATRFGNIARLDLSVKYPASQAADIPDGTNGVVRNDGGWGDFDTGLGNLADGPFCNKPDEGNLAYRHEEYDANNKSYDPKHWKYDYPYFTWSYDETFETFFTPNRQVPSAVLFGSLPSGKYSNWQTLCFSPNPAGNDHPGRSEKYPKDYLWLDLFTMPVVEPYAISEPFSTAGKINMNYQIMPFLNIKRTAGMRAALQPVRVTAIPNSRVADFKTGSGTDARGWPKPKLMQDNVTSYNYRYLVDRDETLKAFDAYFAQYENDQGNTHKLGFFKSAAQICDFYLYPRVQKKPLKSWSKDDKSIKDWWGGVAGKEGGYGLTGDNLREKPYADLYARLTTKSNTYCVHIRAQVLRQSGPTDTSTPDIINAHYRTWDEKRDRVIGEYRGSSIVERYIDPQDERFVASARNGRIDVDATTGPNLDVAYRFRVLNTKRFDP